MSTAATTYELEIPGLVQAVAKVAPSAKHGALLSALRRHDGPVDLTDAKITAVRDGAWLGRRKVLNAAGELVHDDHETWLKAECERDGGSVTATWQRLMPLDYQLTECPLTTLYVVARAGALAP